MLSFSRTAFFAFLFSTALTPVLAYAESFDQIPLLPGGPSNSVAAISPDGTVIVGTARNSSNRDHAVKWVNGSLVDLGTLPGGLFSSANAVSNDGTIIAGAAYDAGFDTHAARWVNGSIQALGYLSGGNNASAFGISGDGSTIVGFSNNSGNPNGEAVKWINGGAATGLGILSGANFSQATGISNDGSVIIGISDDGSFNNQPVKWVNGGAIQALPLLSGSFGGAVGGVSGDGSIIVGSSTDTSGYNRAVKWVNGGTPQDLGILSNGTDLASDALAISKDGTIIVGRSTDQSTVTHATIWANGGPIQSIADILTAKGVDLTGWSLDFASGVSNSNGNSIVIGNASLNGSSTAYIANITTGGVTTPEVIATSVQGSTAVSQQANQVNLSGMSQSLFAAEHLSALSVSMAAPVPAPSPNSVSPSPSVIRQNPDGSQTISIIDDNKGYGLLTPYQPSPLSRLSVYTVGSMGLGQNSDFDNREMNGTVGASVRLNHDMSIGVGILGASSHINTVYEGKSDLRGRGVSTVFSYLPQYGFRAFGTAYMAALDLTINRGYMNGSSMAGSRGTPNGNAHGAAAEIGYAMPINSALTSIPFVDTRWSKTSIDAYSETGGPFNADFSTQKDTNVTSHLGYELDYKMNQKTNLYGRASWGHRFDGGDNGFTANISGLTQSLSSDPGDRNWAEGTLGTNYQATEKIRLSAEISGRTGVTQQPVTTVIFGANISF